MSDGLIERVGVEVPEERPPYFQAEDWVAEQNDDGEIRARVIEVYPGDYVFDGEDPEKRKFTPHARLIIEVRPWGDREPETYTRDVSSVRELRAWNEYQGDAPSPELIIRRRGDGGTGTTYDYRGVDGDV